MYNLGRSDPALKNMNCSFGNRITAHVGGILIELPYLCFLCAPTKFNVHWERNRKRGRKKETQAIQKSELTDPTEKSCLNVKSSVGALLCFRRSKQPVLNESRQGKPSWLSDHRAGFSQARLGTFCPTLVCWDSQTYIFDQSLACSLSSKSELPGQVILLVLKEIAWSSWP